MSGSRSRLKSRSGLVPVWSSVAGGDVGLEELCVVVVKAKGREEEEGSAGFVDFSV